MLGMANKVEFEKRFESHQRGTKITKITRIRENYGGEKMDGVKIDENNNFEESLIEFKNSCLFLKKKKTELKKKYECFDCYLKMKKTLFMI